MTHWNIAGSIELLTLLRKRLIVIVAAVVIGMGVSWNFSAGLLTFVEKPLTGKTYLTDMKRSVYEGVRERWPAIYDHYKLDKDLVSSVKKRPLNYSTPLEPFFIQCKISLIA